MAATTAAAYHGLVQSWPELVRLSQQGGGPEPKANQEKLL
jgi:hypothetical protein